MAKPKKTPASSKASAAKKSSAPDGNNRLYVILGAVALVAIAGFLLLSPGGGDAATEPVEIALDASEIQRARGITMGDESAPVQLHEFADYQCPACAQFSTFAHPLIEERLVDEGLVHLVRYDFPLVLSHPHAFLAARAARCAEEGGQYWEYHDVLYGRQPTWSTQRDPSGEFVDYAELLGLDRGEFEACLQSDRYAEEVTRNLRLGESLGVNGTPTLMINGERIAVRDYQELEERVFEIIGRPVPGDSTEAAAPAAPAASDS